MKAWASMQQEWPTTQSQTNYRDSSLGLVCDIFYTGSREAVINNNDLHVIVEDGHAMPFQKLKMKPLINSAAS